MLVTGLLTGCWVLPESKLDKIVADPNKVTLTTDSYTGITEQTEVTAYYEDGTSADVTSNCEYSSSNTEVVTVNNEGLIVAVKVDNPIALWLGATILVTYTQHNFWTSRIIRTDEVDVTVEY